MIDCVTISNNHCFAGNPLLEQHKLRYKEVIAKEKWDDIYLLDQMEFDQYDNLATEYYIYRDQDLRTLGVTRSYPTKIPYMLQEVFPHLFADDQLISDYQIFEASRLVLDRERLTKEQRIRVVNELLVAYMERALERGVKKYVGFMLPKIWESTFLRIGWDVEWLGPEVVLPKTNYSVRAGMMPVNEEINQRIRLKTGIHNPILNHGSDETTMMQSACFSQEAFKQEVQVAA